ncbi:hypothetical protein AALO_G00299930 [Alosa alosa]|uniref:Secreted protein n=1 Tax=Alosa alosa TaxID=278164 RepID=A0AAV6FE89_9TELE|nr:hypothetical protein AALO_G00299930 [Alosa alosa]
MSISSPSFSSSSSVCLSLLFLFLSFFPLVASGHIRQATSDLELLPCLSSPLCFEEFPFSKREEYTYICI